MTPVNYTHNTLVITKVSLLHNNYSIKNNTLVITIVSLLHNNYYIYKELPSCLCFFNLLILEPFLYYEYYNNLLLFNIFIIDYISLLLLTRYLLILVITIFNRDLISLVHS